MRVLIEIPSSLKQYLNNQDVVEVVGISVEETLDYLCKQYTEIKQIIFDKNGIVRNFINIYLNDYDIRYAEGIKSTVMEGDIIQSVPLVAGGSVYS